MGKPYVKELAALPETYNKAIAENSSSTHSALRGLFGAPLIAIGSGGSFSGAVFAAELHERLAGQSARAVTPLELRDLSWSANDTAYLLISASGRNPDVLAAFRELIYREPRRIVVLTAEDESPLMKLVRKYRWVDCIRFSVPSGRDGFLATNSLLAFCTLLAGAYGALADHPGLPAEFGKLLSPHTVTGWRAKMRKLCGREDLILLYSPVLRAAAVDIESKCIEAALGHVLPADLRHFAHGRHHWLAKHGEKSAILAFHSTQDRVLANRTLRLLPAEIPQLTLEFAGPLAHGMLASLVASMIFAGERGVQVGIDPGRPGVPPFGSRIYRLTPSQSRKAGGLAVWRDKVIERKAGSRFSASSSKWAATLEEFLRRLEDASFQGLVLDYDGTLCDPHERFVGICSEIASGLVKLLSRNVPIGIATGRGKSVREALRAGLPKNLWPKVLVGFYSGGQIVRLDEDKELGAGDETRTREMAALLGGHPALEGLQPDIRSCQLSYAARANESLDFLWREISDALSVFQARGWRAFRSDHSVDVLAAGVTKTDVVKRLREDFSLKLESQILCVGDQAREPGNDAELLREPLALSVGTSSSRLNSGWNLARPGERGVGAMLRYLKAIRARAGAFRMSAKALV